MLVFIFTFSYNPDFLKTKEYKLAISSLRTFEIKLNAMRTSANSIHRVDVLEERR